MIDRHRLTQLFINQLSTTLKAWLEASSVKDRQIAIDDIYDASVALLSVLCQVDGLPVPESNPGHVRELITALKTLSAVPAKEIH
jgi:hypothetical protein